MTSVIDTDNYSASGIEVFPFPGGEWHANVPKWRTRSAHIFAKLRSWDDVGKLLVVADALRTQGVSLYLFAPYFPGLRQDRNPDGLTPLTSRIYGRALSFVSDIVTTVDHHSEAGLSAARDGAGPMVRYRTIDPVLFLPDLITDAPTHVLIPDAGAAVRSRAVANLFGARTLQAEKKRDFATGKLSGFSVPVIDDSVERILIPDDICDGGGTFLGLLAEIRKQTEAPVDLYVTHGIFSKGIEPLKQFDKIYTTNSFYSGANIYVFSIDLLPYYLGGLRP